MRKSLLLWTGGLTVAVVVAGVVSGALQEFAIAATKAPIETKAADQAKAQPAQQTAAATPAPAAQPAAAAWASRCSSATRQGAPECVIEQSAVLTKTGQLIASITVRLPAPAAKPVMMLQVPVGLYLPAGLTLQVDQAEPVRIALQTCDVKGCYAGEQIPDEMLAMMKSGKTLAVGFQNLARQNITVPMTLAQFDEAYRRIQ